MIHRRGPWRGFEGVEDATLELVAWFNTERILEPLGYGSPAEFEEQRHRTQATPRERLALNSPGLLRTRGDSCGHVRHEWSACAVAAAIFRLKA